MNRRYIAATWGGISLSLLYLVWITAPLGLGGTPDSANYLAAARSMAAGEAWVIMGGRPLLWWPPLFPLTWSLSLRLGMEPLVGAWALNLIAWVGFAYAWAQLCFRTLKNTPLFWLCWMTTLLSLGHLRIFAQALSDCGFLALLAFSFLWLHRSQAAPNYRPLVFAALFAAAACMWRYLGVTLVLAGATYLWFQERPLTTRIRRVSLWFVLSLAPLFFWLVRNALISGTLTGPRPPASHSLGKQVYATLASIGSWLSHPLPDLGFVKWILIALLLVLGSSLLWQIKVFLFSRLFHNGKLRFAVLLCLFSALYLFAFLILSNQSFTSLANSRFVAPMIAPVMLGCAIFLAKAWELNPNSQPSIWLVGAWVWLFLFAGTGFFLAKQERRIGWGIRSQPWQSSQLMEQIRTLPKDSFIFSNARPEIYLHTDRDGAGLPQQSKSLPAFCERLKQSGGIIAWSDLSHKDRKPYRRQEVWRQFPKGKSRQFADGWLLIIAKPGPTTKTP